MKRDFDEKICIEVGRKILTAYNKWTENPLGNSIVIPIKIPCQVSDQPDWAMNITVDMPWFIERYFENGEYKTKHWSLKEFMGAK